MKRKFFHASPERFSKGDILLPLGWKQKVFLNDNPIPHYSIAHTAAEEGWQIYEVQPVGGVVFRSDWDELVCRKAVVQRCVGSARGLLRKYRGRRNKEGFYIAGTRSRPNRTVREVELRETPPFI